MSSFCGGRLANVEAQTIMWLKTGISDTEQVKWHVRRPGADRSFETKLLRPAIR